MSSPIDNNPFKHIYEDPNVQVSNNPLAAPQKPFNINAAQGAEKTKKDLQKNKKKKKDKSGNDIEDDADDESEEDKPLPRNPWGLK